MTGEARRFRPWHVVLVGALALAVLAAMDLGLQEVYHRYLRPSPTPTVTQVPTATPTWTPSPRPTRAPTPSLSPSPSPSPLPTAVLTGTVTPTPQSFEDTRFEETLQRLLFQQQLLKASLELLRAEDYLETNDLEAVERELIAVSATLERASRFADESYQATIADLQRDLSRLREDLYVRPERLREGLRRLWQLVEVLIGE